MKKILLILICFAALRVNAQELLLQMLLFNR